MEDPGSRMDRIGKRQQWLVVERRFEMERVERTLVAKAYKTVWPPMVRDAGGQAGAVRRDEYDSRGKCSEQNSMQRRGRYGSGTLVAMGG